MPSSSPATATTPPSAARRHGAGPARPRHEPLPRRCPRHPRGDGRRGARARHRTRLARRQLRHPVEPRGLRPSHRPDGSRRARGRRDHARRTARAASAAQHRADDQDATRARPDPDRRRPPRAPARGARRLAARATPGGRHRALPRRGRAARGGVRHHRRRPRSGQPRRAGNGAGRRLGAGARARPVLRR